MDKWMDSPWVLRSIALLLAVMLYISVAIESQSQASKDLFGPKKVTETVMNMPLDLYFDKESLVVSGAPNFVNVELAGTSSIAKTTSLQKNFTVYADLRNLQLGTHRVQLNYENVSEKLNVKIVPDAITVTIQEKITKEFPIEVDFVNKSLMKEGYTVGKVNKRPGKISITGAKEEIAKIALVKAIVDLKGIDETFQTKGKVSVYDSEGRPLDVEVGLKTIEVDVEVIKPNKSVPISFKVVKGLNDKLSLVGIEPEFQEVTIFSDKLSQLNEISGIIDIPLDLSEVKENTTLEVEIRRPSGVDKILPNKVKVRIIVENKEKKTFENISISVKDSPAIGTVIFKNPENGTTKITLIGAPSLLKNIRKSDIVPYITIANTNIGVYSTNLQVDVPDLVTFVAEPSRIEYEIK